ncbi:MAG: hypothetical protein JSS02_05040 [Planctomycetes bacterium]|nr:hypothetical protein [Planctomycetota bacterium]
MRAMLALLVLAWGGSAAWSAEPDGSRRSKSASAASKTNASSKAARRANGKGSQVTRTNFEESSVAAVPQEKEDSEPQPPLSLDEVPAPATDPAWPNWHAADHSERQPVNSPIGFYELVRPAFGLFPEEEGQFYERHVASEADLDFNLATSPQPIDIYRPDGVAPAGVIGDHTLNTLGRVMVSYRFNDIAFDGLKNGSQSTSVSNVLSQFTLSPTSATAQNNLFILEYATSDDLTFQSILPVIQRRIHFVNAAGVQQVTDQTDLSDVSVYALYVLHREEGRQLHVNLGVQLPVGVFDTQGQIPQPDSPLLTYPMRTSDGTWDFLPGLTYRGQSDNWTWGAQGLGTVRFGINRFGYRLGDEGNFNGWASRRLTDWASLSTRLNYHLIGNISGADKRLNPNLTPTNVTSYQAGQQLNLFFGMNFVVPEGLFKGQRIGFEGGLPLYQWYDGPQLKQSYQLWMNVSLLF